MMEDALLKLKETLFEYCKKHVEDRIQRAQQVIQEMQRSANEETKSSVGDKYETGRAMIQLEIEKHSSQLAEALKQKQTLDSIPYKQRYSKAQPGAVVVTTQGNFFICISAGQVNVHDKTFLCVSQSSPIAAKLFMTIKGSSFIFNNKPYSVEEIY